MEQTNANVDQDDGPVEVSSMPGRVYLGPINGAYLSMTPNEARDIAEVLIDHAALADDGADA